MEEISSITHSNQHRPFKVSLLKGYLTARDLPIYINKV